MTKYSERTKTTYHYERIRAVFGGVIETATTFLLFIAVRYYDADQISKALIAGGGSIGLILTPWIVSSVEARRLPVSKAAAYLAFAGAFFFGISSAVHVLPVFLLCSVLAMTMAAGMVPLLTHMYHENYPEADRGRLFARNVVIRVGVAALFSQLVGRFLKEHLEGFPWVLATFTISFIAAGYCLAQCPTDPISKSKEGHPFRALRFVREDRLFRTTLITWMLMGFANLMMLPLRVEYLANPDYKIVLDAETIALVTLVIPNIMRLLLIPVWGWVFDHLNFMLLRVLLNLGFAIGILTFFLGDSLTSLALGGAIFGISNAGGDVAWSLWVTKLAPPSRVADYMAVHTFFTGVRGVIAPIVSFHLILHLSITTMGWFSAGLIILASLLLVPEIRLDKRLRPATPLNEEISN
jgi:MFS family permease